MIESKMLLQKILPPGKECVIAAAIHSCRKCGAAAPVYSPCPSCKDNDRELFADIRFPQGKRAVIAFSDKAFEGSFGWIVPWVDPKNGQSGMMLADYIFLAK
jgi:hypothetical protein